MTLPLAAERYLDELTLPLSPADPVDRVEIVTGIREHIAARLSDGAPDVDAVLAELGSPDAVARQTVGDAVPVSSPPVPVLARGWVVPTVVTLLTLALLGTSALAAGIDPTPPGLPRADLGPLLPSMSFNAWEMALMAGMLVAPVWVPAVVLAWASPLWRLPWKAVAIVVPFIPISTAALFSASGSPSMTQAAFVLAAAASVALLVGLVRAARTRRAL